MDFFSYSKSHAISIKEQIRAPLGLVVVEIVVATVVMFG
jgi:hypothetical protein